MIRPRAFLAGALAGPAALYRWAVRRRNRRYDRPDAVRRVGVPVISVGNVTVGGTGKTPMTAWLIDRLLDAGRRPAVVSRGYGGTAGSGPLLVTDGRTPPRGGPRLVGDEPWLLARTLGETIVVVGSDRVAGAELAVRSGADVLVLDDGFQHRRLARDLDVVLLDATDPFGNGRLLPAGPLREPLEGLARADVIVLTRAAPASEHAATRAAVARHAPGVPVVLVAHRPVGFVDHAGAAVEPPTRALAFCGIAGPESFERTLAAAGVAVAGVAAFRDHHRYDMRDLQRLYERARAADATLVTTEKDLARLDGAALPGPPPIALRIELDFRNAAPLLDAVRGACGIVSR